MSRYAQMNPDEPPCHSVFDGYRFTKPYTPMKTIPQHDKLYEEAKRLTMTTKGRERVEQLLFGLLQISTYRETNGDPTVEATVAKRVLDGIHFSEDTDNDAVSPMFIP